MNVSACLVTRGDVDMQPILDSLPDEWEKVIWVNGIGVYTFREVPDTPLVFVPSSQPTPDLSVYGRYAAIEYASHDLIYVQDDDVIVSDPQEIVDEWYAEEARTMERGWPPRMGSFVPWSHVVCNVPPEFRPHYPDSGLVGFGAAFHRDAPKRAFDRFHQGTNSDYGANYIDRQPLSGFRRRADNVFTTLTPRVLVDVPKTDLPYASNDDRMWKQPGHVGERDRMIELARQVRDA